MLVQTPANPFNMCKHTLTNDLISEISSPTCDCAFLLSPISILAHEFPQRPRTGSGDGAARIYQHACNVCSVPRCSINKYSRHVYYTEKIGSLVGAHRALASRSTCHISKRPCDPLHHPHDCWSNWVPGQPALFPDFTGGILTPRFISFYHLKYS